MAALTQVDLEVGEGELGCLLGPSGAGKTTLLRVLDMLESPDSGQVLYDGQKVSEVSERETLRRRMVMVLQKPLVFKRSVEENVAYGLRVRRVPEPERRRRVVAALRTVGLEGFRDRWAPSLSAGEQQRVAFARAIVLEPSLLLLDEFTANLDPANVKMLETALREFRRGTGATVVLASHDLFQVKRLRPHVHFLDEGRLVECADAGTFLDGGTRTERARRFVRGEL